MPASLSRGGVWSTLNAGRPAPQPRPPLPPFPPCPSCPSPFDYYQTLPYTPPPISDKSYLRCDAWSVVVPGLPFHPGGSAEHPERFLSYKSYWYDDAWIEAAFAEHAKRGYPTLVHSWPDARSEGGYSEDAFMDLLRLARQYVPYNKVFFGSKYYDPQDQTADEWMQRIGGPLERFLDARLVDDVTPSWEHNLFNVPGRPTIDFFRAVGELAHNGEAVCFVHFSPHVTSWFADGDPRGRYGFWDDLGDLVDGIDYQGDPSWDVGQMQSRMGDTQKQFGEQGSVHKIRAFEWTAATSFSHDQPDENQTNALGYLAQCQIYPPQSQTFIWGYGLGARRPDGSFL